MSANLLPLATASVRYMYNLWHLALQALCKLFPLNALPVPLAKQVFHFLIKFWVKKRAFYRHEAFVFWGGFWSWNFWQNSKIRQSWGCPGLLEGFARGQEVKRADDARGQEVKGRKMAKNMGGSCFFCIFGFGFWDRFRVGFGALWGLNMAPRAPRRPQDRFWKFFFGLFLTVKRKHFYRHEVVDFWAPLGRWLLDNISLQHMVLSYTLGAFVYFRLLLAMFFTSYIMGLGLPF